MFQDGSNKTILSVSQRHSTANAESLPNDTSEVAHASTQDNLQEPAPRETFLSQGQSSHAKLGAPKITLV